MFEKNFRRNLYSIELASWKSLISLVCGFPGNKKRGKLSSTHVASTTELPKVRMADVIENLPLLLTPQVSS
jgi:hypothetical protein